MLGVVRRYGAAQALRASVSRSLYARSTPQLLAWKPSSAPAITTGIRPLHNAPPARNPATASAQVDQVQDEGAPQDQLREFQDLRTQGLVDPTIVNTITRRMMIQTMTDVQSMTLRETLKGDDV